MRADNDETKRRSLRGAMRVRRWAGGCAVILLAAALVAAQRTDAWHPVVTPLVLAVCALPAYQESRRIIRLNEVRIPQQRGVAYAALGGAMGIAYALLSHAIPVPALKVATDLGIALVCSSVYAAAVIVERRHGVRVYYTLEGVVLERLDKR